MNQFTNLEFWESHDLFSISIDGLTFIQANDVDKVLSNYRFKISDAAYASDHTRMILSILEDENGKELETSSNLFLPIELLNELIEHF
ncbi:MAG TPA: hypothetical protein ENH91_10280 [Leeuwenhoekiella sp.]|nr:hypothetical protein [Leeuwenhoekiella sp.]